MSKPNSKRSVLNVTACAVSLLGLYGCKSLPPIPAECPAPVPPPPEVMAPLPEPLHLRDRLSSILDAAYTTSPTTATPAKPN